MKKRFIYTSLPVALLTIAALYMPQLIDGNARADDNARQKVRSATIQHFPDFKQSQEETELSLTYFINQQDKADEKNADEPMPVELDNMIRVPEKKTVSRRKKTEGFNLSTAEQLRIKVIGHTGLSGDYIVNADQNISFPAIGHIDIRNMTLSQLEEKLGDKVGEMTQNTAYVTVEVLKYRPIFTSGYLMKPGEIEWKPGMTVQRAVSLSGGLFRITSTNSRLGSSAAGPRIKERLKLDRSVIDMQFILAELAGLQAERINSKDLNVPNRLLKLVGKQKAEELINFQNELRLKRQSDLQSHINALHLEKAAVGIEVASLQTQHKFLLTQLKMTQKIWKGIKSLKRRRHVSNIRHMQARKDVAKIQAQKLSIMVAIARVQRRQLEVNHKIISARQDRQQEIAKRIEILRRNKARQHLEISSSQKILDSIEDPLASTLTSNRKSAILYRVTRKTKKAMTTRYVDETAELKSNDILTVIPVRNSRTRNSDMAQRTTN